MSGGVPSGATFPFSAVVGAEPARTALLCAAVDRSIKGVLLRGPSGTAKTVLARSASGIDPERRVVNVPLNVTDEMLFGTIDVEEAVATGNVRLEDGILLRADGGWLYVDDADLLEPRLLAGLLDAVVDGRARVEREGISAEYPVDATVIASAGPSREALGAETDRFDMCATLRRAGSVEDSAEIARRSLLFRGGELPDSDCEIAEKVAAARRLLPEVEISDAMIEAIATVCRTLGVKGMRGPIAAAKVSKALAALDGRTSVSSEDVRKASVLCLDHRRPRMSEDDRMELERRQRKADAERELYRMNKALAEEAGGDGGAGPDAPGSEGLSDVELARARGAPVHDLLRILQRRLDENKNRDGPAVVEQKSPDDEFAFSEDGGSAVEVVALVGEEFETIDLLEAEDSNGFLLGDDAARRRYAPSDDRRGRYVKPRIPNGRNPDLAFDATIRAAAPRQRARRPEGGRGIVLEECDLREKVRRKPVTSTFLFLVDTSGSLIIRNRIGKVKAAIKSMLETHYVKRDRVGLMTFNEDGIDLVLAPTRAVELLEPIVRDLAVGRGTPLSEALDTVYEYMVPYTLKHPDERCHIVMFTDGKATRAMRPGADPDGEALEVAESMDVPGSDWIVIDTGIGYSKSDAPRRLASALRGRFFLLDDLESKEGARKVWKDRPGGPLIKWGRDGGAWRRRGAEGP